MWKALIAGTTILTIAGSTLASAQQSSPAERPHHAQLTADDIAAFTDARIAALKTALKLTPADRAEADARPGEELARGRAGPPRHQQGAARAA